MKINSSRTNGFFGSTQPRFELNSLTVELKAKVFKRMGAVKGLFSSKRFQSVFTYFIGSPYWSRNIWHGLYRHLFNKFADYDRDKPIRFFDINPDLDIRVSTTTYNLKDSIKAIVGYVQKVRYSEIAIDMALITVLKLLQVRNFPLATRTTNFLKWSKLNSIMSKYNGIPLDIELFKQLNDNMPILASEHIEYGMAIALPLPIPVGETYLELPIPSHSTVKNPIASAIRRLLSITELGFASQTRTGLTPESFLKSQAASGGPGSGFQQYGMIVNTAFDNLLAALDFYATTFPELMQFGHPMRDLLIEEGLFSHTLQLREVSDIVRESQILDLIDYSHTNMEYGSYIGPVPRAHRLENNSIDDVDYLFLSDIDVHPLPHLVGRTGGYEDNNFDLDTDAYINSTPTTADRYELDSFAKLQADSDTIDAMTERQTFYDIDGAKVVLLNYRYAHGAIEGTGGSAPIDTESHYPSYGAAHATRTLMSLSADKLFFMNDESNLLKYIQDPNVIMYRSEFEEGLVRPIFDVSPMRNPMDPFQHGFFQVLSIEDVNSDTGMNWASWFNDNFRIGIGEFTNTTHKIDSDTPFTNDLKEEPMVSILLPHVVDGIVWIGDAVFETPLIHFLRSDTSRATFYGESSLIDVPLLGDGSNRIDHSICPIPTKPFTKMEEDSQLVGLISESGVPILGIEYDATAVAPVMYETREVIETTVTVSLGSTLQAIWDALFSVTPTNLIEFLFGWWSWPSTRMGISKIVSNEFTIASDIRLNTNRLWDPIHYATIHRLAASNILDSTLELFSHVNESSPLSISDIPPVTQQASVKTGTITDGIKLLLDIVEKRSFKPKDRDKRDFRKGTRGKDKSIPFTSKVGKKSTWIPDDKWKTMSADEKSEAKGGSKPAIPVVNTEFRADTIEEIGDKDSDGVTLKKKKDVQK